jgi:hypothetical protein
LLSPWTSSAGPGKKEKEKKKRGKRKEVLRETEREV